MSGLSFLKSVSTFCVSMKLERTDFCILWYRHWIHTLPGFPRPVLKEHFLQPANKNLAFQSAKCKYEYKAVKMSDRFALTSVDWNNSKSETAYHGNALKDENNQQLDSEVSLSCQSVTGSPNFGAINRTQRGDTERSKVDLLWASVSMDLHVPSCNLLSKGSVSGGRACRTSKKKTESPPITASIPGIRNIKSI